MSLLDLEDPPFPGGSLTSRAANRYGEERSGRGQQSSELMYSSILISHNANTDIVRTPEILEPEAKIVVGRILAISSAFNAKDMVHIESIVMFAMAPFVLLAGEYCIKRSVRLRGLYRMKRQTLLSLRSLRQYWKQRQLPLSRIYCTRMMKTQHGLVSYERTLSL